MKQAGTCFDAWLHHRGGEGNPRTVAKLLSGRGYLKTEKEHFAVKIKPPGEAYQRMFHILPAIFDLE